MEKIVKKIEVSYKGGQSRYGQNGCDFMMAEVPSSDGDVIELYAERDPGDYGDEETATYADLKADILAQAREKGVNSSILHFWYD